MLNDVVVAVVGAALAGRLVPGSEPESGPSHAATATVSNDATTARILNATPNSQLPIPDSDYRVDANSSNIADETASGRSRGMK